MQQLLKLNSYGLVWVRFESEVPSHTGMIAMIVELYDLEQVDVTMSFTRGLHYDKQQIHGLIGLSILL